MSRGFLPKRRAAVQLGERGQPMPVNESAQGQSKPVLHPSFDLFAARGGLACLRQRGMIDRQRGRE